MIHTKFILEIICNSMHQFKLYNIQNGLNFKPTALIVPTLSAELLGVGKLSVSVGAMSLPPQLLPATRSPPS